MHRRTPPACPRPDRVLAYAVVRWTWRSPRRCSGPTTRRRTRHGVRPPVPRRTSAGLLRSPPGRAWRRREGRHGDRAGVRAVRPRCSPTPVLGRAARRPRRRAMVSICTGASCSPLRRARRPARDTHWRDAADPPRGTRGSTSNPSALRRRGRVLTSAGVAAGSTCACTSCAATTAPRSPDAIARRTSSRRTATAARRSTSSSRARPRRLARRDPRLGARAPARAADVRELAATRTSPSARSPAGSAPRPARPSCSGCCPARGRRPRRAQPPTRRRRDRPRAASEPPRTCASTSTAWSRPPRRPTAGRSQHRGVAAGARTRKKHQQLADHQTGRILYPRPL